MIIIHLVIVQRCPDGDSSLPEQSSSGGYKFCGRGPGREECGRGFYCEIHPSDRYAICCPGKLLPDSLSDFYVMDSGGFKFCGRDPWREDCGRGF